MKNLNTKHDFNLILDYIIKKDSDIDSGTFLNLVRICLGKKIISNSTGQYSGLGIYEFLNDKNVENDVY